MASRRLESLSTYTYVPTVEGYGRGGYVMNVWYLNHYIIHPSATSEGRPYYIARAFADRGHQVALIGASHHHLMIDKSVPAKASIRLTDSVRYDALPARSYNCSRFGRFLNMMDFSKEIRKIPNSDLGDELTIPDLIIASNPHLFVYPAARHLARRYGAKLIFEVRDLWPESLIEVGRISRWHPLILWMAWIERQAYRTADYVVALPPRAEEYMIARGLDPSRFACIPNGVSPQQWEAPPDPLPPGHQDVFDQCRAAGKFIVVYTGALGIPNTLDQVLDLNRLPRVKRPYHVVLIGDGICKAELERRIKTEKIDFVTVLPRITKAQARNALAQADACFIGWGPRRIYHYGITPNKIGDYFMAGKPVIHAVKAGNDPVAEAEAGISVPPYDPTALDDAIRTLACMDQRQRDELGERGRQLALEHLNWDVLGEKYVDLCERLTSRS